MTSSRLLLGFLLAVAVGLIASRLARTTILKAKLAASLSLWGQSSHGNICGHTHPAGETCGGHDHAHGDSCCGHDHAHADNRLVAAFRSAMKDFVDVGVYFTIGVAITALFNTGIAPGARWLDGLAQNPVGAPAALMALAFILSLCSTSDAFIAATLAKFSWGAKLAFLTFGPMMDVKLLFLYQSVLNKRFIAWLGVGLFFAIGSLSILWQNLVVPLFLR